MLLRRKYIYAGDVFLFDIQVDSNYENTTDCIRESIEETKRLIEIAEHNINRFAITNPKDYMIPEKDTKYSDNQCTFYDGVLNYIENSVAEEFEFLKDMIRNLERLEIVFANPDTFRIEDEN